MRVHRFRQSWVNQFYKCPEQARQEQAGQLTRTPGSKMMLGTATHAAIEAWLRGEDWYPPILHALNDEEWEPDLYTPEQVTDLASELFMLWYSEVWPGISESEWWDPEVEFERLIHKDNEREIWVAGTADLLLPDRIIDWKTSTRPYQEWEHRRWNIQGTTYTYALDRTNFELCVLQYPKMEVQQVRFTRTPAHHDWLTRQLVAIARLIEHDLPVWPLNDQGWWCHQDWCGAWADCKGVFMSEGWEKP